MKNLIEYLENNAVVPQMTIVDSNLKTIVQQYKPITPTDVRVVTRRYEDFGYHTLMFNVQGVEVSLTVYKDEIDFVDWVRKQFKRV